MAKLESAPKLVIVSAELSWVECVACRITDPRTLQKGGSKRRGVMVEQRP
jgi:hypothetical protein